jgi:hypothetical protein
LALTKRTRGLPVFSPLDEWEPFDSRPLADWDFVFVDLEALVEDLHAQQVFKWLGECEEIEAQRKEIQGDATEPVDEDLLPQVPLEPTRPQVYVHEGLFPYTGSRWYAAEVCEWLLQNDRIPVGACRAGLRATRHVPSDVLTKHFATLEAACEDISFECAPERHKKVLEGFQKRGILSMIGLWNCTSQHAWKQIRSNYQVDAGNGVRGRKQLPDGTFMWTASTELVDLYSMAPWGRIALDVEQLRIAQAMAALEKQSQHIRVAGAHVDGVFFLVHTFDWMQVEDEILDANKFPDGKRMFQIKDEPSYKVPTYQQPDPLRQQKLTFTRHVWRRLDIEGNADVEQLVARVKEHNGLLLTGPAGTGKSYTLGFLLQSLPGRQLVMALRHCTAMLICGKTISYFLHKYRRNGGAPAPGTIVIIDEWSEVQLHTWMELARWKLMVVIFILVGDADGQRKPIFDRWQDAMNKKDIRDSQLIHELCGGLRVHLMKYQRGEDEVLFRRYTELYKL